MFLVEISHPLELGVPSAESFTGRPPEVPSTPRASQIPRTSDADDCQSSNFRHDHSKSTRVNLYGISKLAKIQIRQKYQQETCSAGWVLVYL